LVPANILATFFDTHNLGDHSILIERTDNLSWADSYEKTGRSYSFNQTILGTVLTSYVNATSIPGATTSK
jgi:hypothetical protein